MSHLRVRHIEKPIVISSLTYHHRPCPTDRSSSPSFLKLSEKNSEELTPLSPEHPFHQITLRLNRMEAKSIRKIYEVQANINHRTHTKERTDSYTNKVMMDGTEAKVTYRLQQALDQGLEECNFQMDENLNYVQFYSQQNSSNLARRMIEAKETLSEPHLQPLLAFKQQAQKSKNQSRRSSLDNRSQLLSAHQSRACLSRSVTSRRKGGSSCKSSKGPTGIYEQILSNYTTAKLLALQRAAR